MQSPASPGVVISPTCHLAPEDATSSDSSGPTYCSFSPMETATYHDRFCSNVPSHLLLQESLSCPPLSRGAYIYCGITPLLPFLSSTQLDPGIKNMSHLLYPFWGAFSTVADPQNVFNKCWFTNAQATCASAFRKPECGSPESWETNLTYPQDSSQILNTSYPVPPVALQHELHCGFQAL